MAQGSTVRIVAPLETSWYRQKCTIERHKKSAARLIGPFKWLCLKSAPTSGS